MTATTALRTPLTDLIARIRVVVDRGLDPARTATDVARYLKPALLLPELVPPEALRGSPDGYTQHVLHVEPGGAFSVVALVWLPGQATPVHDHLSWCTVGVYEGQETETLYRLAGPRGRRQLVRSGSTVNARGSVSAIAPPGDIHHVANTGRVTAVSLHVYGADIGELGSSIRRCYDEAPAEKRRRRTTG
ncbi:cysteine dioxygenase family protein [Nocardioides mesophilus]|uniref:Cysteine dioxygenase family protein n=1 Tax=Nocardioides mesophilus TaxID=433659 RepID=A0A7G9R6T2_9ACTN|nr:cysteine dioxygenase family protein [Nocardioides mesophilus]QNN51307.1 cysteine dioxygenase family protein [Nocardioides mesophilus]